MHAMVPTGNLFLQSDYFSEIRLFRKYDILYIESRIWGFDQNLIRILSWGKMKKIWLVLID